MSYRDLVPDFNPDLTPNITRPALKRVRQMSESHCGPAVLEMLLSFININISQIELATAIGADEFIHDRGLSIPELARIIKLTAPEAQFWYKDHTSTKDLATIVNDYRYPAGVEWQGLFYDSLEDEIDDIGDEEEEFGHYSIVTSLSEDTDTITLRDPYKHFSQHDRFLSLEFFESRWWDINEIWEKSYPTYVRDERMMFIVTRPGNPLPSWFDMKQVK